MELTDRFYVRAPPDLVERVEAIADRYGMDDSQVVRLLVRSGVQTVERGGLDAIVHDDNDGETSTRVAREGDGTA